MNFQPGLQVCVSAHELVGDAGVRAAFAGPHFPPNVGAEVGKSSGETQVAAGEGRGVARTGARGARRRRTLFGSPIARLILASNLAGLIILIGGALILNEMRAGLVQARASGLVTQGQVISSLLAEGATIGEPEPEIETEKARELLRALILPRTLRARLYNRNGELIADSFLLSDQIDVSALPPPGRPGAWSRTMAGLSDWLASISETLRPKSASEALRLQTFEEEFTTALAGGRSAGQRFNEAGDRIISVSQPVQRVSAVVGVITLESSDAAEIVQAERAALVPFIGVAIIMAILTTGLLTLMIARPLRRLSLAAERVRAGTTRELDLPRLSRRKDEIGDLTRSMEAMTAALFQRIVANERFAADVAHELKNPLTSIRSAIETAERVQDNPEARERLRQVIAQDVQRLDRLITDISNASRLEGEIARQADARVDLAQLLTDIADSYRLIEGESGVRVSFERPLMSPGDVRGLAGPLGQVFRNLIDNARSFSPPEGQVRLAIMRLRENDGDVIRVHVDDDGPGIPPDRLEKIFDRFYTDRPKGSAFGNNSGLGLSIVRQIVASHNGRAHAENRTAADGSVSGARFVVDLRPA